MPLILTWVAIGGGFDAPNIYNLANFVRAVPDGAVLTLESSMLNVLPVNMMAIAMGLRPRPRRHRGQHLELRAARRRFGTVEQIEQITRISREFGREIATGKEARRHLPDRRILRRLADETLARNGFAPNRQFRPARRWQHAADREFQRCPGQPS